MKRLLLLLPALLAAALMLHAAPVQAEDPNWRDTMKSFKGDFKTKNPLKIRRKAVKSLAKSQDGRAVKELLKVVKTQERHARKLRAEWVREEEAWQEKTDRLQKQVDRKREQAKGDTITVTDEEDEWLGLSERYRNKVPKMITEKNRIQGLYKQVLDEEDTVPYIFKSVARVVNSLEGDEKVKAGEAAARAASSAKTDHKPFAITMLAYMKSEAATDALVDFAKETSTEVVILALEAIGRQNQEKGIAVLTEKLEDPRWQIRAAAIKGLSYYKDARVVDALIARAKNEEGVLRRKYYAALARIVQEKVPGTVEAWESWWRENKEDQIKRWEKLPKGEPVEGEPPDIPIDTALGSTSFYGIRTDSKHIIFIVDISGSMGEGGGKNEQGEFRIDVARKELKNAIQSLSAEDEDDRGAASFNIVIYESTVAVYKPGKMVKATKSAKEKAFKWIDENVQPKGYTNIYDAVEQAFNIISDSSDSKNLKKGADTIFLMTDGVANRGKFIDYELMLSEIKKMNATRKITLHTIGVGAGHNRPFLSALAAQNDGQYLSR
jgi:HEAT repeat protein